jgi:glucokinase
MGKATGPIWGVEIGGSKLQIFSLEDRTVVDRWTRKLTGTVDAPLIRRHIDEGVAELLRNGRPVAVGVGFGGPVDRRTGRIDRSHQIAGWEGFSISDWIAGMVACPVFIENDSNVATLAEATVGAGQGFDPVFYFNMGSGVGGGLVVAGRIYHGAPPGEVEFGHLRLSPGGPIVEQHCSGWAVDRLIARETQKYPQSRLASLCAGMTRGQAVHLRPAIEAGDELATRIVDQVATDAGFALSHAIHLFHPAVVVMGGGLSLVGEPLRAAIERHAHGELMDSFLPGPPVKLAQVGEDAVPIGAAINAEQQLR